MIIFNLVLSFVIFLIIVFLRLKFEGRDARATYIIAVHNDENRIEGLLRLLFKLQDRVPGLELIVIDQKSSDQTPLILNRLAVAHNFKYYQMAADDRFPFEAGLIHADSTIIIYRQWDHSPIKNGTQG